MMKEETVSVTERQVMAALVFSSDEKQNLEKTRN